MSSYLKLLYCYKVCDIRTEKIDRAEEIVSISFMHVALLHLDCDR
jgi:hypothetical protein